MHILTEFFSTKTFFSNHCWPSTFGLRYASLYIQTYIHTYIHMCIHTVSQTRTHMEIRPSKLSTTQIVVCFNNVLPGP